jgi:hypothetical protein
VQTPSWSVYRRCSLLRRCCVGFDSKTWAVWQQMGRRKRDQPEATALEVDWRRKDWVWQGVSGEYFGK